jgi:hypothetical protein
MKQVKLLRSNPTENGSSPRESITTLTGGINMEKQVVRAKFVEFCDELTFISDDVWNCAYEVIARDLQGYLVEDINGTIEHLVRLYEADFNNSRKLVTDLVTAIREINKFDFVVDESHFSEVFRANETLHDVFVVGITEDKYEFVDENFGEDFI